MLRTLGLEANDGIFMMMVKKYFHKNFTANMQLLKLPLTIDEELEAPEGSVIRSFP